MKKQTCIPALCLLMLLCTWLPSGAFAAIVDFEGLSSAFPVPDGYAGLNWDNFNTLNLTTFNANVTPGGDTYAYLNLGPSDDPPPFLGITSAVPGEAFDFTGGWFTSGWTDNLELQVEGYRNSSLVSGYQSTIILDLRNPQQYTFNFTGVDEVRFIIDLDDYNTYTAWTGQPGYWEQQYNFMLDDLDITGPYTVTPGTVPAPGSLWLLGCGLLGLARWSRKTGR